MVCSSCIAAQPTRYFVWHLNLLSDKYHWLTEQPNIYTCLDILNIIFWYLRRQFHIYYHLLETIYNYDKFYELLKSSACRAPASKKRDSIISALFLYVIVEALVQSAASTHQKIANRTSTSAEMLKFDFVHLSLLSSPFFTLLFLHRNLWISTVDHGLWNLRSICCPMVWNICGHSVIMFQTIGQQILVPRSTAAIQRSATIVYLSSNPSKGRLPWAFNTLIMLTVTPVKPKKRDSC